MENNIKLYNENDLKIMELALTCKKKGTNRIEQIKEYAAQAGFKKIGIAYCVSVTKYAKQLEKFLEDSFEVIKVNCKCAEIPSNLLVKEAKGISCNPAGQAKILEEAGTEFNICLGLCLGHDIIFDIKSKTPSTTLIVKDKANNHNTLEGFASI